MAGWDEVLHRAAAPAVQLGGRLWVRDGRFFSLKFHLNILYHKHGKRIVPAKTKEAVAKSKMSDSFFSIICAMHNRSVHNIWEGTSFLL